MNNTTNIDKQIRVITEESIDEHISIGKQFPSSKNSILIVKKGAITFTKSFKTITLAENNIYFSFPNGFFELKEISKDVEIAIVAIDPDLFSKLSFEFNRLDVYQFLISNYSNHFTISETAITELWKLTDLLQLNLDKTNNKFTSIILLNLLNVIVYIMFESINSHHDFTSSEMMTRKQELVFEFLKLLSIHYKKQRKVSFYAKKLLVTPRYLSATIKMVTQRTANEVIHQYIIAEAKMLLTSTNKRISEISDELNFNDQYYFSNFFKKHTGINPSEFKEKNKKEYIYTSI